jgi:predicted nucleic acid-binding protein
VSIYADSSFLTSMYVLDVHTSAALDRIAAKPAIWLTPFHEAEIAHAISQSLFCGRITAQQADFASRSLANDSAAGLWLKIDFPTAAFQTSIAMARQYGVRIGCRTLDSLHVACALEFKAAAFWTFDERQRKLAKAAGLKTS